MRVSSAVGALVTEVLASEDLMPGVACLPHGFGHDRPGTRQQRAVAVAGASYNDLSDPAALDVARRVFHFRDATLLDAVRRTTAIAGYAGLRLHERHTTVPCTAFIWPNDRSYTREPVVEFHTLGSPPVLEALVATICDAGARPAEPGEFTLRAFLAGRMDLTQAIAMITAGTIDAQENPLSNTVTYGVHKFHHFHTLTGHFYVSRPIFLYRTAFQAWPAELQRAMRAAITDAVAFQRALHVEEEDAARAAIAAHGCEIAELTGEQRGAFVAAVGPLVAEARATFGAELFELAATPRG